MSELVEHKDPILGNQEKGALYAMFKFIAVIVEMVVISGQVESLDGIHDVSFCLDRSHKNRVKSCDIQLSEHLSISYNTTSCENNYEVAYGEKTTSWNIPSRLI
jgi:hypothetical protein